MNYTGAHLTLRDGQILIAFEQLETKGMGKRNVNEIQEL